MGLSLPHILIFAVVAILLLGGGRFSAMMGDVAKGVKNFKKGMSEEDEAREAHGHQQHQHQQQLHNQASAPQAPLIEGRTAAEIIAEYERQKAAQANGMPPTNPPVA